MRHRIRPPPTQNDNSVAKGSGIPSSPSSGTRRGSNMAVSLRTGSAREQTKR